MQLIEENKPIISIIIPCYNAEPYIDECLDSITKQSLFNIEIIAVDDGSNDYTLKILNSWANNDNRIIVTHQTNKGVSSARNIGLSLARAPFITFLDADDWVGEHTYELAVKKILMNGVDCVFWNAISKSYDHATNATVATQITNYKRENGIYLLTPDILISAFASVWNKLFKREIIISNSILFPSGVKIAEDASFLWKYSFHANNVYILNECTTFYRYVSTSICHNKKVQATDNFAEYHLLAFEDVCKYCYTCGFTSPDDVKKLAIFFDYTVLHNGTFFLKDSELSSYLSRAKYLVNRYDLMKAKYPAIISFMNGKSIYRKKFKGIENIFAVKNIDGKKSIRFLWHTFIFSRMERGLSEKR